MSTVKVRDCRRPGHFWADNELLDVYGPKIGIDGLAVYMALSRVANNHTGECVITLRQIAEMIGCSPQTAMRAIVKLESNKLVIIESKGSVTSRQPSVYTLCEVPKLSVPIGNRSVPSSVPSSVPIGNTFNTINTNNTEEESSLSLFEENQQESSPRENSKKTDERHDPVRRFIVDCYTEVNGGRPAWGGREAKLLADFLRSHGEWSVGKILDCVRDRFHSEENLADEPVNWISKLAKWASGPLDKFGKPKSINNGKSQRPPDPPEEDALARERRKEAARKAAQV